MQGNFFVHLLLALTFFKINFKKIYIKAIETPRILGVLGRGLFIFRELGSTDNYFRGAWEEAHAFVEENQEFGENRARNYNASLKLRKT